MLKNNIRGISPIEIPPNSKGLQISSEIMWGGVRALRIYVNMVLRGEICLGG